jgi:(p)ppGpp synthase/HD superfamily hydrolase
MAEDFVARARRYAEQAHGAIDHRRKYSGRPYVEHLERVAQRVAGVCDDRAAIAAAWLHDVVEDTPATHSDIKRAFGEYVAELVFALTDQKRTGFNRAQRKAADRARLASAPPSAQTVKLADLIDNAEDIAANDPNFGRVYLHEMGELLDVLTKGDPKLLHEARATHARLRQLLDKVPR